MAEHGHYVLHAQDTLLAYCRYRCGSDHLVRRAIEFAAQAHADQLRDGGEPYIIHPVRVATHFLAFSGGAVTQEHVAAAVLHDVLEDNHSLRQSDIAGEFGEEVSKAVDALSKDTAERKLAPDDYRERILAAPEYVRRIKLCDRLDNIISLRSCPDNTKVRRYLQRTEDYYRSIGESSDPVLLDVILKLISDLECDLSL